MNKLKQTRRMILTILLSTVLFISGCGTVSGTPETTGALVTTTVESTTAATVETTAAVPDTAYPLTKTDAKGNTVVLPQKPMKIASMSLGADEMLLSLVSPERIIGLTYLSDDAGLSNVAETAKQVAVRVGKDMEQLIALAPDLVILSDFSDDATAKMLTDAGIPVFALRTSVGIEQQIEDLRVLATLVGEPAKGEELVAWMTEVLDAVNKKVSAIEPEKQLTVISLDSFYATYGADTTFDALCEKAGLVNLATKAGMVSWNQISKEKVVEMNPDVIILPAWSYEGFDATAFMDEFLKDPSLAEVSAVKNNRVFALREAHTTAISQYIVLGVEDLAKAAYPALFQ